MSAPLYEKLEKLARDKSLRFCMPGHKAGVPFKKKDLYAFDTTELSDTDNLHHPDGVILQAQRLAACAFGAKRSYFLVNGSSCGVMAMFASVLSENDTVLVDRNCHISVIHALTFCGAKAKFITGGYDESLSEFKPIDESALVSEFEKNPGIKAIFVTSPTYFGKCQDLSMIKKIAHKFGAYLLVDEAHGAHFAFSPRLPDTALMHGADITVQSVHKTLPALTQSAILHIADEAIADKVEAALRIFQTTSPSYILMSHIDKAREIMSENKDKLERLIDNIEKIFKTKASKDKDITRLRFYFDNMSGFEAEKLLLNKGILVEMADAVSVVCIVTIADTKRSLTKLKLEIDKIKKMQGKKSASLVYAPTVPEVKCTIRQAYFEDAVKIPLCEACGHISKDMVVVYPPGVPVLIPGCVITQKDIDYIQAVRTLGAQVHGLCGNDILCLKRP